jgi:phage terminase large subunit
VDEREARNVLAFARKREAIARKLRALCFPQQRALLDDRSRLKALLTSRRAGKSFAVGIGLVEAALEAPNSLCFYIGLTRETSKDIMWEPILKRLNKSIGLGLTKADFNETSLTVRFRNGSRIRILGMDNDASEMEKRLGVGVRRVCIDEAASFSQDLKLFIDNYIEPATADVLGDIWLTGTPGIYRRFFYKVTHPDPLQRPMNADGRTPQWAHHSWHTFDNPFMKDQWETLIAAKKAQYGRDFEDTPEFKTMYQGCWYDDESRLCYHYHPDRNMAEKIPELESGVVGIDLGYNDDSAFVVVGWTKYDRTLYAVHGYKEKEMTLTAVAEKVMALQRQYPFVHRLVVDGAAKQSVEEMRQRFQLPFVATEKKGKADVMALLDNDLRRGEVKVLRGTCEPLIDEWSKLVWDKKAEERNGRRISDPRGIDHLCLVAGTQIQVGETLTVDIEDVRGGDLISTTAGFRHVLAAAKTGVAPIWEMETERGILRGTGNHPVWSLARGWVPMMDVRIGEDLLAWPTSTDRVCAAFSGERFSAGTQSHRTARTDAISKGRAAAADCCIGSFGRPTTDRSRLATTYITGTMTRSTTESATSKQSPAARIRESMFLRGRALRRTVLDVANSFVREMGSPRFAVACAGQPIDGPAESMMKIEPASNAGSRIGETSTRSTCSARVRALAVRPLGVVAPVYNLTVDGEHEYFANGILVSNCDAMLYAHRYSRNFLESPEEKPHASPIGSPDWMAKWLKRREQQQRRQEDDDWYGSDD